MYKGILLMIQDQSNQM